MRAFAGRQRLEIIGQRILQRGIRSTSTCLSWSYLPSCAIANRALVPPISPINRSSFTAGSLLGEEDRREARSSTDSGETGSLANTPLSCPAKTGHPVFQRRSRSIERSLGYGSSAFADDDSEKDVKKHSRGAICVRVMHHSSLPRRKRAQGMPGARRTHCLACKRKRRTQANTGTPKSLRHSLRNGFTAAPCSPRGTGLVSPRR